MALIDPNGTYKNLQAPDSFIWLSYYHQKRFRITEDDDGNPLDKMIIGTELHITFEHHRSKTAFFNGDIDSLLGHEKYVTRDLDLINMLITGQTTGNILYEKVMVEKFKTCVADL